jgi:hypothetical protein
MNVTLNTNTFNNNRYYNQKNNAAKQNFTANPSARAVDAAEEVLKKAASEESSLFKPFLDFYDKCTDKIAEKFTSKVIDSKPTFWIADKLKNSDNLFQHCLTTGSIITSGLYMQKTLTNDKLDKDRKRTLAVNQGLTFVVSTIGAYTLDKSLKNWWENVTAKYAGFQLGDEKFAENFKNANIKIAEENKAIKAAAKKKGIKPELKSLLKVEKEVRKHDYYKSLEAIGGDMKEAKAFMGKIKGMGMLRSMIVFALVYRYIVPVAVTKPANIFCEKYLAHKKAKAENQAKS